MWLVCLVVLVVGGGGCARNRHYSASNFPAEYQARPVYNAQTVDLSRFAGPPASNERVDCGDVLEVSVAAGLGAEAISKFPIRIGDDGKALVPEVGYLELAGLELPGAEQVIAAACVHRELYRQPQVTVTMKHQRANRVTVVGAVKEPGMYELSRGSSCLMGAIVAAGGLDEDAGTKVEIRRPVVPSRLAGRGPQADIRLASHSGDTGRQRVELVCLDLAQTVMQSPESNYLEDGTVVRVERRHPEPIQVVGLVRNPGQYDFPVSHELRLFGAIAMAGGLSNKIAEKVYVIRCDPQGQGVVVIEANLRTAKHNPNENLRLAQGDIVSVEQTLMTTLIDVIHKVGIGFGATAPMF